MVDPLQHVLAGRLDGDALAAERLEYLAVRGGIHGAAEDRADLLDHFGDAARQVVAGRARSEGVLEEATMRLRRERQPVETHLGRCERAGRFGGGEQLEAGVAGDAATLLGELLDHRLDVDRGSRIEEAGPLVDRLLRSGRG